MVRHWVERTKYKIYMKDKTLSSLFYKLLKFVQIYIKSLNLVVIEYKMIFLNPYNELLVDITIKIIQSLSRQLLVVS